MVRRTIWSLFILLGFTLIGCTKAVTKLEQLASVTGLSSAQKSVNANQVTGKWPVSGSCDSKFTDIQISIDTNNWYSLKALDSAALMDCSGAHVFSGNIDPTIDPIKSDLQKNAAAGTGYYVRGLSNLGTSATTQVSVVAPSANLPSVSWSVATQANAWEGTNVTVVATLSAASTSTVTVPLSFSGTATNGIDYNPSTSTLIFTPGQTSVTLSFVLVSDGAVEGTETVSVAMGAPTGANLGAITTHSFSILDSDGMYAWTGAGGDGLFGTAANWYGGSVPFSSSNVYFHPAFCSGAACNLTINGTNVTMNSVTVYSGFSGTITQGSSVIINMTGGWSQASGTFLGSTMPINIHGTFNLSAGYFRATSGTLSIYDSVTISPASTFMHNNGLMYLTLNNSHTVALPPITLKNLTISGAVSASTVDLLASNFTVEGGLSLIHTVAGGGTLNNGTINVQGNLSSSYQGWGGTALIKMVGGVSQTMSGGTIGNEARLPNLEIANSGSIVVINDVFWLTGNYTYTSGTISAGASSKLIFDGGAGCSRAFNPGGTQHYYAVAFRGISCSYTLNSDLLVDSALTLNAYGTALNSPGGYRITAKGAVDLYGEGLTGTSTLSLVATGSQSLTSHSAAARVPRLEINSSGYVNLLDGGSSSLNLTGDLSYLAGTLASSVPVYFSQSSSATINLASSINLGEVHFSMTGGTMGLSGGVLNATKVFCGMTGDAVLNGGMISNFGDVLGAGDCSGTTNFVFAYTGAANFNTSSFFSGTTSVLSSATLNLQSPMYLGSGVLSIDGTLNATGQPVTASTVSVNYGSTFNKGGATVTATINNLGGSIY